MKMFYKKDEGFTLVELMVVVLIIGILVAIAIPVFNAARANAQTRACLANLRTVQGAVEAWRADNVANDPTGIATVAALKALLEPNFVKVLPANCPQVAANAYTWTPATTTFACQTAGHAL